MPFQLPSERTRQLLDRYRYRSVSEQLRYAILTRIESGMDVLPDIQGRKGVKDDVTRALLSGSHCYLVSEEGTGKTRLARSVARLLPPVPRIAGCPYNDDPTWTRERLCPKCRESADPVREFGIEWLSGEERFSRVQGNEYTNEAKLLGLKDIQAIAAGMSPGDPRTFTGTGVFRANRGILFLDELPAIRTKVQVLLHPIIEERKAVLEEYGWEYPLDLCLVSTGNPEGFTHVNEVPRPLLDRLEMIYMDLPDEEVELEIALRERMGRQGPAPSAPVPDPDEVVPKGDFPRPAAAPWMLVLINKAARQSRVCRWLERQSSIRATLRAVDHAHSSAEMMRRRVVRLADAGAGLKLALRGRVQLRQDLVEFENPAATFRKLDELSEDLLSTAIAELAGEIGLGWNRTALAGELSMLLEVPQARWSGVIQESCPHTAAAAAELEVFGRERCNFDTGFQPEGPLVQDVAGAGLFDEYRISAAEFILALCVARQWLPSTVRGNVYIPAEASWTRGVRR